MAKEIDFFDIVIRLNYRGMELLPNPQKFGSRIDVSYYNRENCDRISEFANQDFYRDLHFSVFKGLKY